MQWNKLVALFVLIATLLASTTTVFAGGGIPSMQFPCTQDDGQATIAYGGDLNSYTQWKSSHGVNYIEYSGELLTFVAPENGSTWEEYPDGNRIWMPGQVVTSKHFFVDCYQPSPVYPYYAGHMRPTSTNVAEWLLQKSNSVSFGNPEVQRLAGQLSLRSPKLKIWMYSGELRMFNTPWGVEIVTQTKTYRAGELTPGLTKAYVRFTQVDPTP